MLLIDILNSLHFAGADFVKGLDAAQSRKRWLTPLLRSILAYAAEQPGAYECRFTPPLLAASAFLLAEFEDPAFLALAQPLIDTDAEPSLLGYSPEDAARLIAKAAGKRIGDLMNWVLDVRSCDEFRTSILEAMVLIAAWHPERRNTVAAGLRALLRHPGFTTVSKEVADVLVEGCCRLDPADFLLDLHLAIGRSAVSEELLTKWITVSEEKRGVGIWLDADRKNDGIGAEDPFLRQFSTVFDIDELTRSAPLTETEKEALAAFNSVAAPCRDYEGRFVMATYALGIAGVARRVVSFAASDPDGFAAQHHSVALSAAICLASPLGEVGFAEEFARLVRLPEPCLDRLLGDDLCEMCEWALALAGRGAPGPLRGIVEDAGASICSRSVALGALLQQVRLGYAERDQLAQYAMELIQRKSTLKGNEWFWSDVADIGAELRVAEMLPSLLNMEAEGVFSMSDGGIWTDAEELKERFSNPQAPADLPPPDALDALFLLRRCSGYDSMTVKDFLGRLEPPRYQEESLG
jgi:hypothetical protein